MEKRLFFAEKCYVLLCFLVYRLRALPMIKKIFINLSQFSTGKWWVEVITTQPSCTYYFGPFDNAQEAEAMRPGYLEDLHGEGVESLEVCIKRCQPTSLTIFDDEDMVPEISTIEDMVPEVSTLKSASRLGVVPVKLRERLALPWQNHQNF